MMHAQMRPRAPAPAAAAAAASWWAVLLLGFAAVAVLQFALASPFVKPYDEGLVLYGGARVAHGASPYRDFWSMYGPGSFYVLGGLDRVFGESVLVGRAFDAAVRAAIVVLVFALTRPQAGRRAAFFAAAIACLLLVVVREYLFPALPATALSLLAMLALGRALSGPQSRPALAWAWPGAAVGATLLFRHDFGVYAAMACLWPLLGSGRGAGPGYAGPVARLVAFAAGVAVVTALPVAWLVARVGVADLYENLVRLPLQVYVANRELPFPSLPDALQAVWTRHELAPLRSLAVYVAPLVAAWAMALVIVRRLRPAPDSAHEAATRRLFEALLVLQLLLCLKGSVRVELLHMLPAALVSIVLATLALAALRWRGAAALRVTVVMAGLVAGAGAIARFHGGAAAASLPPASVASSWRTCDPDALPRLGCFVLDRDRIAVLRYLQQHARPGATLYVGTGRHDKLFINNVELYFLSGLPAATRWHDLHPGVQTTREVQAAMIEELTRRPPAFVVRNTLWDDWDEPNASRRASGVTLLDEFLRARYTPVFTAGSFTVSVPRPPAARVGVGS